MNIHLSYTCMGKSVYSWEKLRITSYWEAKQTEEKKKY